MPFCANCGTQVDGRFCPKCGAAINAAPAGGPASPGPAPNSPPNSAPNSPKAAPMTENVASALCYALWFITGIVFLALAPYNQNKRIRFHAFQSIFVSIGIFIVNFALGALWDSFWSLGHVIYRLFQLAWFLLWLFLMWKAYNNEKVVLPIVGPLAEKQA